MVYKSSSAIKKQDVYKFLKENAGIKYSIHSLTQQLKIRYPKKTVYYILVDKLVSVLVAEKKVKRNIYNFATMVWVEQ